MHPHHPPPQDRPPHKWRFNPDEPLSERTVSRLEDPARQEVFSAASWVAALGDLGAKSVADVACGTGAFVAPLLQAVGPRGRVYGVDIDPRMVEYERRRFAQDARFEAVLSTPSRIPRPDASLDAAVLISTFHDLDGDETIREIRRLLRKGGALAVADFKKVREEGGPPYEIRKSEEEARAVLEGVGFRCAPFRVSASAWGILART